MTNDKLILYTTHCPKCKILEKKLNEKHIPYLEVTNEEFMINMGINKVPVLSVNDTMLGYSDAVKYVNNLEV